MSTWGEQLVELQAIADSMKGKLLAPGDPTPYDVLRRIHLKRLAEKTRRAVITYGTAFLESRQIDPIVLSVHLGDVQGFMEAVSNIKEQNLDLFLHSPGGSAEAAESIINYLRSRFAHIRVIVPVAAMSAATMMALGADEIVMGAHSQLGPIDPQFTIITPEGPRSAPGQAILDQFEMAKEQCKDTDNLPAWLPILRGYGPGLLAQISHQRDMGETVVAGWLEKHMFQGRADAGQKAKDVAHWFGEFKAFKSHGRMVGRDQARAEGLRIIDLEANHEFQDAVLSVHHALQHTFSATPAAKVIENHHGRAWLKISQIQTITIPVVTAPGPAPQPGQPLLPPSGAQPTGAPSPGGGPTSPPLASPRRSPGRVR